MRRSKNNEKRATIAQAVLPVRAIIFRLSLIILIVISLALVIIGKIDTRVTEKIRTQITDTIIPVLSGLSSPAQAYRSIKVAIHNTIFVFQENENLRQENEQLDRLKSVAIELESENARLRKLLHYLPDKNVAFMTARVVGDAGGPYNRSVIINSGSENGIKNGLVVINSQGLVGRIYEVGDNSARILLITDINSRVPVMTEVSRERAVLTGNNNELPRLNHLPSDTQIKEGDKVVTSGDGEFFPAGITVGVVHTLNNKYVSVQPAVDWSRLEYITIADYGK